MATAKTPAKSAAPAKKAAAKAAPAKKAAAKTKSAPSDGDGSRGGGDIVRRTS